MNTKKTVTIYDIAKEANASPSMVSRVYNGASGVKAEKRELIESLFKKYSFYPNAFATSLKSKPTKTFGVTVFDVTNPFFSSLLHECEVVAAKNGYSLIFYDTPISYERECHSLNFFSQYKVDAIIQLGGCSGTNDADPRYVETLKKVASQIPVILVDPFSGSNIYSVKTDEARAMKTLLDYLMGLGHRDFFFIGGQNNGYSYIEKLVQYRKTLTDSGIPEENQRFDVCGYTKEISYEKTLSVLKSNSVPSAIIAINETVAMGVLKAVKEMKLRIPEDISVVCFDNTYVSQSIRPLLTSVGCDYKKFAERIIYTAIDVIHSSPETAPDQLQIVESVFVIRESAGPVAPRREKA